MIAHTGTYVFKCCIYLEMYDVCVHVGMQVCVYVCVSG